MNILKLKQFRENLKLSQREIAKKLNIKQPSYYKWEAGEVYPNAKQILELCNIFKCTPNDLFKF